MQKTNKYKNIITTNASGMKFASKLESDRYNFLFFLQQQGLISNLETQVPFIFIVNDKKICKYIADFSYINKETGELRVEDTKNSYLAKEAAFVIKKKLLKALYNIELKIIEKSNYEIVG